MLALLVAAATEEEVGFLWSWGQGARRWMGVRSAPLSPIASMPGGSGVAGLWRLGGKQAASPRAVCVLAKAWARGEACPSEVFPETHFPWAAQEVVSEWD